MSNVHWHGSVLTSADGGTYRRVLSPQPDLERALSRVTNEGERGLLARRLREPLAKRQSRSPSHFAALPGLLDMALRLFVLGGTGRIGGHVLDLALARGHQVTAFVRSPRRVTRSDPRLSVIEGDLLSTDALARALPQHDAVLSSLGPSGREAFRRSTLMADSAASTVAAMTTAGVKRLAIVSAALLFPDRRIRFRFFRWLIRHHVHDLVAMEAVVRATHFDWTIARPPRLVAVPGESYRCDRDALPPGAWSMSFRAVAAFLLDCVERRTHAREVVGLARGAA
jgi:putative NADH-flavin reductase